MKKIYIAIIGFLAFNTFSQTQLTLTKAGQEPAIGDLQSTQGYDSVGVIPKSTGPNQIWNFTSVTPNTNTSLETFVSPASVGSSSFFPGATLVKSGTGVYFFYKSSSSPVELYEAMGSIDTADFKGTSYASNPATLYQWPIAPGDIHTDNFTGTGIGIGATSFGTSTTTSSGSGVITLPNGAVYTNIIQLKIEYQEVTTETIPNATITYTWTLTYYQYFHISEKFPLVTVSYAKYVDDSSNFFYYNIYANTSITIGLKDELQMAPMFSIFPNPAKDKIRFELDNLTNESCSIEIFDVRGQIVLNKELGNTVKVNETINLSQLEKGIYILKTKLGDESQSRKLIVE